MSVAHVFHRIFRAFGSSRWTPWGLGALAVVAQLATARGWTHADVVVVPLLLLALNLVAALLTLPRFRNDLPLLVMHLALIAFLLLLLASKLVRYEAQVVLADGQQFSGGEVVGETRRPAYPGGVEALRFANEGQRRSYNPDGSLYARYSQVRWQRGDEEHRVRLGKAPLVIDSHAIYQSLNWGHAARLIWQGEQGELKSTSLIFAAWRDGIDQQGAPWQPVAGVRPVWFGLEFSERALDPLHDGRTPADAPDGLGLVVRDGNDRWLLAPGQTRYLPGFGMIGYHGTVGWMGYDIVYDPLKNGLLAVTLVLVLAMVGYYLRQMRAVSWQRRRTDDRSAPTAPTRPGSLSGRTLEE